MKTASYVVVGLWCWATTVLPGTVVADDQVGHSFFIEGTSQPFCKTPGGPKKGDLYSSTEVTVLEQRGAWSRVSVEGWVKSAALGSEAAEQSSPLQVSDKSPLEVVGFSTKEVREGLAAPRLYLQLKVKNVSAKHIRGWSGLLVAQDTSQAVLFREPVSDDSADVAPGAEREVSFYWEPREQPFSVLKSASPETVQLTLYKVELR
ncbi:MAG: hypothetical protein KDD69_02735 [Bdellovibrionales bacterium]|nr:hypothetical protein [Bdellovibrionales bacterium]